MLHYKSPRAVVSTVATSFPYTFLLSSPVGIEPMTEVSALPRSQTCNVLVYEPTFQPAELPSQSFLHICGSGVLDGLRAGVPSDIMILEPGAGTWPGPLAEASSSPRACGPQHREKHACPPNLEVTPQPSHHAGSWGLCPLSESDLEGTGPILTTCIRIFNSPQLLRHRSHRPVVSLAFLCLTVMN